LWAFVIQIITEANEANFAVLFQNFVQNILTNQKLLKFPGIPGRELRLSQFPVIPDREFSVALPVNRKYSPVTNQLTDNITVASSRLSPTRCKVGWIVELSLRRVAGAYSQFDNVSKTMTEFNERYFYYYKH